MDAATTALPPPSSSSSPPSAGPQVPVSLRPGGGGRFSFRPNSGISGGSASSDSFPGSAVLRPSGFASSTFPLRQEKRPPKSRSELIRYSKEELLRFKEDWTIVPEEIAGSDAQRTISAFEDPGRRELSYIPERAVEPDTRDWRGRAPMTTPPPEPERPRDQYRERPNPKESRGPGDRQQNVPQTRVPEQSPSSNNQQQGPATLAIVKAANPWSARRGAQSEKEKVIKTVKGILNKLTPEKYDTLLEQLTQSGITSAEILQSVISLVFDKAVLEPTFCSMYSSLCVDLSKTLLEFPAPDGDKPITFRRVLLNTCQSEFEGADALRSEIRQLTAPEQEQQRAEKERNVKLRTLGNIKFIGELFNQKMIPEKIVHACIQELLGTDPKAVPAEENVEAICQLLSTVGIVLDASVKQRVTIDSYFARLKELANSNRLPSRIRFMVRDILDVRSNNWIPRREEVKAKTISEVHAEAEQKLGLRAGAASLRVGRAGSVAAGVGLIPGNMMPGAPGSARAMPGMPGLPGSGFVPAGGPSPFGQGLDGDGWEKVIMRKSKREPTGAAPPATSAFNRLPTPGVRSSGVTRNLPQGSGASFLGKPSALLGGSAPLPQAAVTSLRNGSGFAESGPRAAPSIPVTEIPVKIAERDNRPELLSTTTPPISQQMTELKKKSESLLSEYFSIVDLKEAKDCVKELGGPELHSQFVNFVLSVVFESRDKEQELVSKLFDYLFSEKVLSSEAIRAGFMISAEQFEDLAVDAPLAPKLMGKLLASLVLSKAANINLLVEVSKKIEDDYLRMDVLAATFKSLLSKTSEGQTVALFGTLSKEDLSLFGDNIAKALRGQGLDVLAASL